MPPRAKKLIASLVQHVHDFARENHLTTEDWLWGVDFINRIGQMSDSRRNEGILVCDIIGLETLVDALTNESEQSNHTSSAILGPFYLPDSLFIQMVVQLSKKLFLLMSSVLSEVKSLILKENH